MASFIFSRVSANLASWWRLMGYLELLEAVGIEYELAGITTLAMTPAPGDAIPAQRSLF